MTFYEKGAKMNRKTFTAEELKFIHENKHLGYDFLAKELNRSYSSIANKILYPKQKRGKQRQPKIHSVWIDGTAEDKESTVLRILNKRLGSDKFANYNELNKFSELIKNANKRSA